MFTGIITDVGEVQTVVPKGTLRRVRIACAYAPESLTLGASISCSGICLTIDDKGSTNGQTWFEMDVGAETLAVTHAEEWREGTRLNLERALKLGDELGGHLVAGHVDTCGRIYTRHDFDAMTEFEIDAPVFVAGLIAEKGSVTLDGTSLTVNTCEDIAGGVRFSVLLIPHTLHHTNWADRKVGDHVNLEVDLMARYAARLTQAHNIQFH